MFSSMHDTTRLRRREMIFLNISDSIRAINFKIYHNIAHGSLYISIRNDITIYFRSAPNRTNVSILVMSGSRFLDNSSTDLEKVYCFVTQGSRISFRSMCKSLDIFGSWPRKWKWGQKGRTVVNALPKWLISIFGKSAKANNSRIRSMVVPKCLYTKPEITSSATSGRPLSKFEKTSQNAAFDGLGRILVAQYFASP